MMGTLIICLLFLLSISHQVHLSVQSTQPPTLCRSDERSALLKFKESFVIDKQASGALPNPYPKTSSWKNGNSSECCSWDGVECDNNTGHVIDLDLSASYLFGTIDSSSSIFDLVHLQKLNLADNNFNWSSIPSRINNLSMLTTLDLSYSSFSGDIPSEISMFSRLSFLSLGYNYFTGQIPSSLENLTQLTYISFSYNSFEVGTLFSIEKLTNLDYLDLQQTNLQGEVPSGLSDLTQLAHLNLAGNSFTGEIQSFLPNLTKLTFLDLSLNSLTGQMPSSISNLTLLQRLSLDGNRLNGTVDLEEIFMLKHLSQLSLSDNKWSVLMGNSGTYDHTIPNFTWLGLSSCNLRIFPDFLRKQESLHYLAIARNAIHGELPSWIWSVSSETLEYINFSDNFLTGRVPTILAWPNLRVLCLNSNMLQGTVPIPPPGLVDFSISNNLLSGEIPPSVCNSSYLALLDLSSNNLSGAIPQCLSYFSDSLVILGLQDNHLNGTIPDKWRSGSQLEFLTLGQNQIVGTLPRSLVKCTKLKILDLGGNQINDTFPFWLGPLPMKVLILRSNQFRGTLHGCNTSSSFSDMRVIDLSSNNLEGHLPSDCFLSWTAMKVVELEHLEYLQANATFSLMGGNQFYPFGYSMNLTNKGVMLRYPKVMDILTVIDFSSNKFHGGIPDTVASLSGVRTLNFSSNNLTGHIPSSFRKLSLLESLDLSQNQLTGEIPQELEQLSFLEIFLVSHNRLQGLIPQGNQFSTFPSESFQGNLDLCGKPLSRKCGDSEYSTTLPSTENEDSSFPFNCGRKVVLVGYAIGTVAGILIGHFVTRNKQGWFMRTFGRRLQMNSFY